MTLIDEDRIHSCKSIDSENYFLENQSGDMPFIYMTCISLKDGKVMMEIGYFKVLSTVMKVEAENLHNWQ